jgi:hypothetical protein
MIIIDSEEKRQLLIDVVNNSSFRGEFAVLVASLVEDLGSAVIMKNEDIEKLKK